MILQKLLMPLVVANATDRLVAYDDFSQVSWGDFSSSVAIFLFLIIVAQICIDGGLLLLSKLETKVMPRLYSRIYHFLIHQSSQFHANRFSGSLVTQTNRFANAYVQLTDTFVLSISMMFVLIVISCIILAFFSFILAFIILTWACIFIALNISLTKRRITYSKEVAAADTRLTGYLADSLSNVSAVKSFANEARELNAFRHLARYKANKKYTYWLRAVKKRRRTWTNDGVAAGFGFWRLDCIVAKK